jgi:hypothetical protein
MVGHPDRDRPRQKSVAELQRDLVRHGVAESQ